MKKVAPFVFVLISSGAGAVSCSSGAAQEPSASSPESATVHASGDVVQVTVDGTRIFGPQVELVRDDQGIRGQGPVGVVDLRAENDSIRGVVGRGPTELHVERHPDGGFELRGMFAGQLGNLDVKPDRIEGQLGHCQYNLRAHPTANGVAYDGERSCGMRSMMQPATVTLSPELAALDPVDRGALLAVLLGR